jgi:hypothetical protein
LFDDETPAAVVLGKANGADASGALSDGIRGATSLRETQNKKKLINRLSKVPHRK